LVLRDIGLWGEEVAGPSLTKIGRQLEEKLDYALPRLDEIKAAQDRLDPTVTQIEQTTKLTQQEVNFIEQKPKLSRICSAHPGRIKLAD
jgi:hypothetical protein